MHAHYLSNKHLSHESVSLVESGTWKWLYSVREFAHSNMMKVIGNGEKTSLLQERWIKDTTNPLSATLSDIPAHIQNWTVGDIIQNGN